MISVRRNGRKINAVIPLTPSKSITNRALIIRALSEKNFSIHNQSDSDDSVILSEILSKLPSFVDVKDAGTTYRFLTAYLSTRNGTFFLTGNDRMKQRPVGKLVKVLQSLGADIKFTEKVNYPPVEIVGSRLKGGVVDIDASESSQFISALMLIAPVLKGGMSIRLNGVINSKPYIIMTLSLMQYYGIRITPDGNYINIPQQEYSGQDIKVENDWSAASFWYEIAALSEQCDITLSGLFLNSIQGDSVIARIIEKFGVQSIVDGENIHLIKKTDFKLPVEFHHDFSSCPDLVIPVAFTCAALNVQARFDGVANLRIKESDRLHSLQSELSKFGVTMNISHDSFTMYNSNYNFQNEVFSSHNDHRMTMAIAPLSLLHDEIRIDDHLVVNKSYRGYWDDLQLADFSCRIT